MPFPETERIIYQKSPLDKVICQLRFPPILKIESEIPMAFQEKIIERYPNYSEKLEYRFALAQDHRTSSPDSNKNHEFSSEDGNWVINLTRTFISISTKKYTRWEEFRDNFVAPFEALMSVYGPPFFTRIGLRYINIINKSNLNIEKSDWNELLTPIILGLLSSPIKDSVKTWENNYDILLGDDESHVKVSTSMAVHVQSGEECFMIDNDFYNMAKRTHETTFEKLVFLNQRALRLFRWIITDQLHKIMEPRAYEQ